jgi:RNA polymerase sigma-70 factor, ECF subfamily
MTGPRQDDPVRDDRDLLRAHVEGDPDAFGTLFARHRDRLWAVALRTTGDPEEAADALQDALVAAFRRADSYRGDSAVTTWLHRIVVNACLDRHRRQKVRRTEPLADDGRTDAQRRAATAADRESVADPADVAVGRDRRDAVLRALATLPFDQRAALVLVDMEGYSVEETAVILGCRPGTVKSRCARGRARLVPLLQQHAEAAIRNPAPPSRVRSAGGRAAGVNLAGTGTDGVGPGAATATGDGEEVSDGDG